MAYDYYINARKITDDTASLVNVYTDDIDYYILIIYAAQIWV